MTKKKAKPKAKKAEVQTKNGKVYALELEVAHLKGVIQGMEKQMRCHALTTTFKGRAMIWSADSATWIYSQEPDCVRDWTTTTTGNTESLLVAWTGAPTTTGG